MGGELRRPPHHPGAIRQPFSNKGLKEERMGSSASRSIAGRRRPGPWAEAQASRQDTGRVWGTLLVGEVQACGEAAWAPGLSPEEWPVSQQGVCDVFS